MKGIFISRQLEFRLLVEGDEFRQGDSLRCCLSIKNHGGSSHTISNLRLDLVFAKLAKGKKKGEEIFTHISSAPCPPSIEIGPGKEERINHVFELARDCVISDKAQSLCFLYGVGSDAGSIGQLALSVQPHRYFQQIVEVFESEFQFIEKNKHSNQEYVNIKFKPSSSPRFALVDELILGLRLQQEELSLRYLFKVKKVRATASSVGVTKDQSEVEQRFGSNKYLLSKDFIDNRFIGEAIEAALSTVAGTTWF